MGCIFSSSEEDPGSMAASRELLNGSSWSPDLSVSRERDMALSSGVGCGGVSRRGREGWSGGGGRGWVGRVSIGRRA